MAPTKVVWGCCLLVVLVDGGSDFPGPQPREAARPSEGTHPRNPRQSQGQESFSFQSIKFGAEATEELQLDAPESEAQLARAGRQFSLNVQFPRGGGAFDLAPNPGPAQFDQQSPFNNFPSFVQPTQPSPSSRRVQQPIRSEAPAPAFTLPTPRASRLRPNNADPRRNRPVQRFQDTRQAIEDSPRARTQQRFQDVPSTLEETPRRIDTLRAADRQTRKRVRPPPRSQQVQPEPPRPTKDFPVFNRGFTPRRQEEDRQVVVVTENPFILKCLDDAEKHATAIEELQNRTALHIDYAQEKQIEIELLETTLEEVRNQSKVDRETIVTLQASVKNLTDIISTKDVKVSDLREDIVKQKTEFEKIVEEKEENILTLTVRLENASAELSNMQNELKAQERDIELKNSRLEKVRANVKRLSTEKKNLLQIVQALAEIGNPALNFSQFIRGDDNEEDEEEDEAEGSAEYDYETSGDGDDESSGNFSEEITTSTSSISSTSSSSEEPVSV